MLGSPDVFRIGLVTLAGLVAFGVALQVSLAGVYRSTLPVVALKAAPYDAGARVKLAEQFVSSGAPDTIAIAPGLAMDALSRTPLEPKALRVLGQVAMARGGAQSEQKALSLVLAAQRLSRRDLPTQMWLIDYYGEQGDAERVVRQFDLALRSSESARSAIFPLLDVAASDPHVRAALVRTLRRNPNWAAPFGSFAALYGTNLDFDVIAARMLLDPRDTVDRANYSALVHRLVQGERYELAWRVYTDPSLGLGRHKAAGIRNGSFEAAEDTFPFDWSFAQEPELWASRERLADRDSVLRLSAYNGRSGEVAWQFLHLPPGSHELGARFGDIPSAVLERPELRIECAGGSGVTGVLLSLRPTAAGQAPQAIQERFVVPPDCAFQRIRLTVTGEGAQKDPPPWIDEVWIR